MSTFNEADHPRQADGKFTDKPQSAPEITLDTAVAQMYAPTAAQARTPEYSLTLLEAHLGQELERAEDIDGRQVFQWDSRKLGRASSRVHLDDRGDIVKVEYLTTPDSGDQWAEHDFVGYEVQGLQAAITDGRLQAAGITLLGRADNDGGAYGNRNVGAKATHDFADVADIAKSVRADIKRAIEYGALPDTPNKPRVTIEKFSGGQAINVTIYDQPDSLTREPMYDDPRALRATAYQKRLCDTVEKILAQYNDEESDSMTDYYSQRFYTQVQIVDEHTQRWEENQRAERAQKRAGQ